MIAWLILANVALVSLGVAIYGVTSGRRWLIWLGSVACGNALGFLVGRAAA